MLNFMQCNVGMIEWIIILWIFNIRYADSSMYPFNLRSSVVMMSQLPTKTVAVIFSPDADADVSMQTIFTTFFTDYNFDFGNVPSVNDT